MTSLSHDIGADPAPCSRHVESGNDTSRLLALPPELRNNIYGLVLEAPSPAISIRVGGAVESREPALLVVCRQVRSETKAMHRARRAVTATAVTCEVEDFDFSHLISVLDTVSYQDMTELNYQHSNTDSSSKFRVILHFTNSSRSMPPHYQEKLLDGLSTWLRYLGRHTMIHGSNSQAVSAYLFTRDVPQKSVRQSVFEPAVATVCAERTRESYRAYLAPALKQCEWAKLRYAWDRRLKELKLSSTERVHPRPGEYMRRDHYGTE